MTGEQRQRVLTAIRLVSQAEDVLKEVAAERAAYAEALPLRERTEYWGEDADTDAYLLVEAASDLFPVWADDLDIYTREGDEIHEEAQA